MARRMSVADLVQYIFDSPREPLAAQVARWANRSPRFRSFAESYRDKMRKKARVTRTREARDDLRFELLVAYRLLDERRFTLEYEKYAAGGQRGPDFTMTYRTQTLFNVEVTRLRAFAGAEGEEDSAVMHPLIRSLCAKLGQMRPSASNVITFGVSELPESEESLARTMVHLLQMAEQKDEAFLARHGFKDARDFFKQYLRLSAIHMQPVDDSGPERALLWSNPQARHPLPTAIATILRR